MSPDQFTVGLLVLGALIVSLSIHEAAHALAAYWLGDSTARNEGRLTLNPLRHLDPTGTVMMAFMALGGTGIGWAKPVPVNPMNFRNRIRDMGLVAVAGPISNLLQAWLGLVIMRLISQQGGMPPAPLVMLLQVFVGVNLSLAAFNMVPIYPLDGQKVLSSLLPAYVSRRFDFLCVKAGLWPLLLMVLWEWVLPFPGPLRLVLGPIRSSLAGFLESSTAWI